MQSFTNLTIIQNNLCSEKYYERVVCQFKFFLENLLWTTYFLIFKSELHGSTFYNHTYVVPNLL